MTNGEYNDSMPEEQDIEDYLAEIKQKMKRRDVWDDVWIIESNETDNDILGTDMPQ